MYSYTAHQMELEVQRVSRELFKAFNGMNAGFEEVSKVAINRDDNLEAYSRLRTRL